MSSSGRGRSRSPRKRNLPPNLYERRDGYYAWRDPSTGKEHGLGRDRAKAVAEAVEANLYITGLHNRRRLIDRLKGVDGDTVADWCPKYQAKLDERELAKSTRDAFRQRLRMVEEGPLGPLKIDMVTTRDVADFIGQWETSGKKRMAQAVRSFLQDMFREAIAAGWCSTNPVDPTRAPRVKVTRARLTLKQFKVIHAAAVEHCHPWVARSMELALVTGQRREDIRSMGHRDVRDGKLWVVQQKTGAHVCIPLDLRLQAVNWSVAEVIARCKDAVISSHFIHHSARAGQAKPGHPVRRQTITGEFARARDLAKLSFPAGSTPPTFHEIRSLAARLYTEQGTDAQALLGHKSPDMTAIYRDVRGAEWIEVR